jgi:phosphoribosylformylglycinamidine synthase
LSELVEATGGKIDMSKLPIGDPTLSDKEIAGNESQERMGLVIEEKNISNLKAIADRERAPMYIIGEATGDHQFVFEDKNGNRPINLTLKDMFGNPPKTIMKDSHTYEKYKPLEYDVNLIHYYIEQVLQLESVACKDLLTNKVDRSVTGKVAKQQTAGTVQLPLNNLGVVALDFNNYKGIASSIGHAPVSSLIDAAAGSVLSIAEALTNIVWAPLADGIKSVSLSANWMWPCKNNGEDARLYDAVSAASEFAIKLGLNIPTGKDSLSMTQKYPDGKVVLSPGTVIISAAAEVDDFRKVVEPVLKPIEGSSIIYVSFNKGNFCLGGSSFGQITGFLGKHVPNIQDTDYFLAAFNGLQHLIKNEKLLAGHDISSGGLVTALLEMCFGRNNVGVDIDLTQLEAKDIIRKLFSEQPAVIIQVNDPDSTIDFFNSIGIKSFNIGKVKVTRIMTITNNAENIQIDIDSLRDTWFLTSYLLDDKQSAKGLAKERYNNYKYQELKYLFPTHFTGASESYGIDLKRRNPTGIKSAIIREKGVNGDREMAYSMYLAGMDVKDVHMTDLISGRETLDDINMIVFVGGFSNSDVLGSAKGWAGAFLYNQKAKETLERFYLRKDTLSLGVCNGCQLMMELELIVKNHSKKPFMGFNESHKFESIFLNIDIPKNNSIMLGSLANSRLGIWVAHGEGKFNLPMPENSYNIAMKYSQSAYPGNPNGSDYNVAGICSDDGRHLVMMPHLERAIFPWNWAYYPEERKNDILSPWVEAFVNAKNWINKMK